MSFCTFFGYKFFARIFCVSRCLNEVVYGFIEGNYVDKGKFTYVESV